MIVRVLLLVLGLVAGGAATAALLSHSSDDRSDVAAPEPQLKGSAKPSVGVSELVALGDPRDRVTPVIAAQESTADYALEREEPTAILTGGERVLYRKLERFIEFPSVQHGRVLQIESILAIQEARGAAMLPDEQGRKQPPKGASSISRSTGRAVYYYPDAFPEYVRLKSLPGSGARVPEDLQGEIIIRAHEALEILGRR